MALQYKSRGGSSPQGKPRVFFCCHPADFQPFFGPISEEVLALQNCAIYYYDEPVSAEDRELDLKQMQLFVMPVTTRLLTAENPGLTDFRFAMAHHIPVLPLMQESGLEELFNHKCGDLQFLDKQNTDPTAIPYAEKLKKYLDSVLIGDKLAAKIRAAFDAYIFLSYRKKDRKHAQELMRLIHRNEFCRDIAIWYDEFLTPGENFNDAIKAALEKCGLFALVVTPNLINEINYIMQVEYPMAKEAGKPILPMEMVPTDAEGLRSNYDGIPDSVPTDEATLREALLRVAKLLALQENDNDPEHNYFIGLAYLGGVDVEVDHEKALQLITSAAEAGLPEAVKKLVSMYQTGEGVARNYRTAIQWQEKLVELRKREYEQDPKEKTYFGYFSELWHLGDYAEAVADLALAENVYAGMLALAEANSYPRCRRDLSICYNKVGGIRRARGDLAGALEYYEKSLAIFEALAAETGTVLARRDLSICYEKVGDIRQARGDLSGALESYEKSLAIAEALTAETGTVEVRRDLSICYERVGRIWEARGDLSGALEYYEKSLTIREALAAETGTVEARRGLSVSYNTMGGIRETRGDLSGALEYYEKSLAIVEALAAETNTVQARRDLSVSFNKVGNIRYARGDLSGAMEYYEKSLAIFEALVAEINTVEARRDLSVSYEKVGNIRYARGDLAGALESYEKSLAIFKALAAEINTVEARRDLSVSCNKVGGIRETRGDLAGALESYEKSLAIRKALAAETGTVEARRDLSVSYEKVGNIRYARGDLAGALECYEKSLAIREALAAETGTVQARRDLSVSYINVGDILETQGDLSGALEAYEKFLAVAEALAAETDTVEARRDLSISYSNVGNIRKAKGDLSGALEYYEKSLAIAETLAKSTGTVQSYDDWAVCCYNVGRCGKPEYLKTAHEIWSMLAQQFPQNPTYAQRQDIAKQALDQMKQG